MSMIKVAMTILMMTMVVFDEIRSDLLHAIGGMHVQSGDTLVVFGGHYLESEDNLVCTNETWALDLNALQWRQLRCRGDLPAPRYGHSANLAGSRMFVLGGRGTDGEIFRDMYCLELKTMTWELVMPITKGPAARMFHASTLVGRKLVIHGGWDGESACLDDIWIFDTETSAWMKPKTAGFAPTPRYGHTMNLLPDGRIVFFGGCTLQESGVPMYLNDVRQLDTETMLWMRPRVEGETPTGRYGHTSSLLHGKLLVFFGGWGRSGPQSLEKLQNLPASQLQVLDTETMTWFTPRRMCSKPALATYNHCAAVDDTTNSILLFGGYDGRQSINTFSVVDVHLPGSSEPLRSPAASGSPVSKR
jgi:host cell factor